MKLENKNNFFEMFLGNYFSRMEEKYKSYLFLLSSENANRECPTPSPITRDRDARILPGSETGCPQSAVHHVKGGF